MTDLRSYHCTGSIRVASAGGVGFFRLELARDVVVPEPGEQVKVIDPEQTMLVATVEQIAGRRVTLIPSQGFVRQQIESDTGTDYA